MRALNESSREVVTIPPGATVADAAHQMERSGVGCLVVTDGSRPVGILTDRDLCLRAVAPEGEHAGVRKVEEVMTAPVETLPADATIDDAVRRMRTLGVRRMPIVDEAGAVVGLVSLDDLLALLTGALHELAVEALERRRTSWLDRRGERARERLEHLYGRLVEGVREARWNAQEAFFDELDALEERARHLFRR